MSYFKVRKEIKFRNKSFLLAEKNLLAERTYFLGSIPQRDKKMGLLAEDYKFWGTFVLCLTFYPRLGSPKITISLMII